MHFNGKETLAISKEYAKIKKSSQLIMSSLNACMREIRLRNLSKKINEILMNGNKTTKKKISINPSTEQKLLEKWRYAKNRGNEFSEHARKQLELDALPFFPSRKELSENQKCHARLHFVRFLGNVYLKQFANQVVNSTSNDTTKQLEDEKYRERLHFARLLGNEYSRKFGNQIANSTSKCTSTLMKEDIIAAADYGNYYSAKNRLIGKDARKEYDKEFHQLLLKCVIFEKKHPNVCGFLQETIFRNLPAEDTSDPKEDCAIDIFRSTWNVEIYYLLLISMSFVMKTNSLNHNKCHKIS